MNKKRLPLIAMILLASLVSCRNDLVTDDGDCSILLHVQKDVATANASLRSIHGNSDTLIITLKYPGQKAQSYSNTIAEGSASITIPDLSPAKGVELTVKAYNSNKENHAVSAGKTFVDIKEGNNLVSLELRYDLNISAFGFEGIQTEATISQTDHTINIIVPFLTDLTDLALQ